MNFFLCILNAEGCLWIHTLIPAATRALLRFRVKVADGCCLKPPTFALYHGFFKKKKQPLI